MMLLSIGLFEKTVFADSLLGPVSDQVFGAEHKLLPIDAWTGVLAFSGQIFFDFAGYSLCAIGIALMLGIKLPDNFRYPYGSIGFSEFWQRWHISLSSWLRDYLYIPLGGNRMGIGRTQINLMLTMLLGGLWHGASWTFVVWGALHGIYLIIERGFRKIEFKPSAWMRIILALMTFTCINITWVFFRAEDFASAWQLIQSMFFIHGNKAILLSNHLVFVLLLISLVFAGHFAMRKRSLVGLIERTPRALLILVWAIMIFGLMIVQSTGEQFIYFQF